MKRGDNMKKAYHFLSLTLIAAAFLLILSGCGSSELWDYSVKPENRGLLESEEVKFSGLEWTGKPFSQDANGNFTSQSDIVRIGNLPHHTVGTVVYDSVEKAIDGAVNYDRSASAYYKLLTGSENTWQLAVYKCVADAEEAGVLDEFYRTDYEMSTAPAYEGEEKIYTSQNAYYGGFKDVTLPASWQTQGFDFPIYTNTVYPWADGAYGSERVFTPTIPQTVNPVGFYRLEFDVDPSWISEGRRVYISFGGVESAYYVYVNGHAVGYSEDTFDPCDFDITPYLNGDGKKNLLAVRVHRWCDGSYFENQDFMRLAGIFRDVYLYSTPSVRISDYTVVTDLDSSYTDADIILSADIENTSARASESGEFSVCMQLFDADKNAVLDINKSVSGAEAGETATVELHKKISAPHLWSDEDPYLYTLVITLYDKSGAYCGSLSQQLGIRELSFTPTEGTSENESYSQVLLNGKPLILKGVDRHEMNPETGRYLSPELEETDVKIMKSLNINAVRTSHYPDCESFYNMCDKYGILVVGECNVETHYNVNGQDTETYFSKVVRDRIEAHTKSYKNRTCIIIWSMGNETIGGTDTFLNCISELKQRDPTRPIHFESQGSGGGVDISSTMYSSVQDVESRGTWENKMPYLMCEYAHAMGNSVGNLYEYWEVFRKYDNLLGAFIWDFVDQAIWTEIPANTLDYYGNGKYPAYGGSWGDNPNSGDFCQNGIISADRTIQPEGYEVKYVYQPIWFTAENLSAENKTVSVYNEHRFIDVSSYDFKYELSRNGEVIDSGSFDVECSPLETVSAEIPFNYTDDGVSEYLLTVSAVLKDGSLWGDAGYTVAQEQFDLTASHRNLKETDTSGMPEITVDDSDSALIITADGGKKVITVSRKNGSLSYEFDGETLITDGAKPNFKRARLSNDNIGCSLDNATVSAAENFEYAVSDDKKSVSVTMTLRLSLSEAYEQLSYTVFGNGEIKVERKLELPDNISEIYRYGSTFTLPSGFEDMTYLASGPADTYIDRRRGSPVSVYSQTVSDSFFPYGNPQDTGNKTGVRYIALTNPESGVTVMVTANPDGKPLEGSALHYTPQEIERSRAVYQLPKTYEHTYLEIDYRNRGTGGASCGPETLDQYKVKNNDRLEYSYTLSVFSGTDVKSVADRLLVTK